jgi:oligogalacturonide transporter
MVGFVSNAEQTPQVLSRFFLFFIGGPALLILAGIIAASWFELSPKNSEIVAAELIRLRSGGRLEDAADEVKAICEKVSGRKHEQCNW